MTGLIEYFKRNWLVISIVLLVIVLVTIGKKWINSARVISSVSEYQDNDSITDPDYKLISAKIYEAFHGRWLTEDEETVISLINSLASYDQYLGLKYQYAKDYAKDLSAETLKYLNKKQYQKLIYQ